jgi:hypothetical protein
MIRPTVQRATWGGVRAVWLGLFCAAALSAAVLSAATMLCAPAFAGGASKDAAPLTSAPGTASTPPAPAALASDPLMLLAVQRAQLIALFGVTALVGAYRHDVGINGD